MRLLRVVLHHVSDGNRMFKLLDLQFVMDDTLIHPQLLIEILHLLETAGIHCKEPLILEAISARALTLLQRPLCQAHANKLMDKGTYLLGLAARLHVVATIFTTNGRIVNTGNDLLMAATSFRCSIGISTAQAVVDSLIKEALEALAVLTAPSEEVYNWHRTECDAAFSRLGAIIENDSDEHSDSLSTGLFSWQISQLRQLIRLQHVRRAALDEDMKEEHLLIQVMTTLPVLRDFARIMNIVSWAVQILYKRASNSRLCLPLTLENTIEACASALALVNCNDSHQSIKPSSRNAASSRVLDAWPFYILSRLEDLGLCCWLQILSSASNNEALFSTFCKSPGKALYYIMNLVTTEQIPHWPANAKAVDATSEHYVEITSTLIKRMDLSCCEALRESIMSEYYASKQFRGTSGKMHREEAFEEFLGGLVESCFSQAIRSDVHAASLAVFLSPSSVSSVCTERLWRKFCELRLLYLLDSPIFAQNEALFVKSSSMNRWVRQAIFNGLSSLRATGDGGCQIYLLGLSQLAHIAKVEGINGLSSLLQNRDSHSVFDNEVWNDLMLKSCA